jgi:hypothetical protein
VFSAVVASSAIGVQPTEGGFVTAFMVGAGLATAGAIVPVLARPRRIRRVPELVTA